MEVNSLILQQNKRGGDPMKKYSMVVLLMVVALVVGITNIERKAAGQARKEPIKIGMLVERTGGFAAYGYSHEKVMKAAVAKVNKEGGIMGRPIELYIEDTESKPSVGTIKFRKLVETYGADFVFNSNSSAIAIACAPIAQELKVPYFITPTATELSAEKGNRYTFQFTTNVKSECKGTAEFALKNFGKKWVTVVANFAWGWSQETEFTKYITEKGGTVLKSMKVPLGASDLLPYLTGNIPAEADAIYFANFGSDFLSFIRDLHAIRPDIKKLGAYYAISGQDPKKLGAEADGLYCITSYPTRLEGLNTKFNKAYRDLVGVDADGKEIGTGTFFVLASDWTVWEPFFALKIAIEKSGWKRKEDTPKVIKTLEGMAFKESLEFPQGDIYIRAEDHLAITGLYVEQIKQGDLKVVAKIPARETVYPPLVDYRKEPL